MPVTKPARSLVFPQSCRACPVKNVDLIRGLLARGASEIDSITDTRGDSPLSSTRDHSLSPRRHSVLLHHARRERDTCDCWGGSPDCCEHMRIGVGGRELLVFCRDAGAGCLCWTLYHSLVRTRARHVFHVLDVPSLVSYSTVSQSAALRWRPSLSTSSRAGVVGTGLATCSTGAHITFGLDCA